MKISKSKFCAGVQCLKRLYLLVHSPELAAQPTAADRAIIEQGRVVGLLARQLFPVGVEVCECSLDQAIRVTRELVANRAVPAIFEGARRRARARGHLAAPTRSLADVRGKSTADLKDHHLEDVAIQYHVVSRSGLDVAATFLAHVNRDYVFDGSSIGVRRFFKIRNLTRRVERLQPKLTFQLRSEFTVLAMPKAPDLKPGKHGPVYPYSHRSFS